jgi:hypothetical protein
MLTAVPATGYRFDTWTGDFTSNVTSITLSINGNKNISATFIKVYTLSVTSSPAGGGVCRPPEHTMIKNIYLLLPLRLCFSHWSGDASG